MDAVAYSVEGGAEMSGMRNPCKECIYYFYENNTCQSKKCATGGYGTVTFWDRLFCEPRKLSERNKGEEDEND